MSSNHGAVLSGALGMTFVGGSVAVSGVLADAPLHTAQAVRYAIACLLLVGWLRLTGRPLHRPAGVEWLWLLGVSVSGLVVFNVALVRGSQHAEPAVLAVAMACVPIALATVGPLLEGQQPRARVLAAAGVVSAGAVVVEGFGRCDAVGALWALVVFACEAGFTLLAIPVLGRHGPAGVSAHATWLAAAMFGVLGLYTEGPSAAGTFDVGEVLAIGYLAVGVTAVSFVLWYSCVRWLGAGRAGLLTGVAPIAAAVIGVPVTKELPAAPVWAGVALIAVGLALGLGGAPDHPMPNAPLPVPTRMPPAHSEVRAPCRLGGRSPQAKHRVRPERSRVADLAEPHPGRSADRERHLPGHPTAEKCVDRRVEIVPGIAIADLRVQLPPTDEIDHVLEVTAYRPPGHERFDPLAVHRHSFRLEVDQRRLTGRRADGYHRTAVGQQSEGGGQRSAADVFEDSVHRRDIVQSHHHLVGTEFAQTRTASGIADRGNDMGAGPGRHLDCQAAYPAGGAGDQHSPP